MIDEHAAREIVRSASETAREGMVARGFSVKEGMEALGRDLRRGLGWLGFWIGLGIVLAGAQGCAITGESCTERLSGALARLHPEVSAWRGASGSQVRVVCDEDVASMVTVLPDGSMCACAGGAWDDGEHVIRVLPGGTESLTEGDILGHEAGHAYWDTVIRDDREDQDWDDRLKAAWHDEWRRRRASGGPWPSWRAEISVWEFFAEAYRAGMVDRNTGEWRP